MRQLNLKCNISRYLKMTSLNQGIAKPFKSKTSQNPQIEAQQATKDTFIPGS